MACRAIWLCALLALTQRAQSMHDLQVSELMCVACNATQFCHGGAFYSCPAHSLALPGAATVHDCVCVPGYNRTSNEHSEQCDEGQPPYWYENNRPQACPTHSRTTVERADSVRWCVCDEGFAGPGGGSCEECPPATFSEGLNATRCGSCAPGSSHMRTRSQNRSDCRCGEGMQNEGSVGPDGGPCVCSAGWEGLPGACTPCAPGRYKEFAGDASTAGVCMPCGAGTYAAESGATACLACGAHSQSNDDFTACLCSAGYTGAQGVLRPECAACPVNTFKAGINQATCAECVSNAWSPQASPTVDSCLCNKGYYQAGVFADCVACAAGTYKDFDNNDEPDRGVCASCPANADSPATSVSRYACVCNAGYEGQHGQDCSACAPGKFWRQIGGGSECAMCEAGKYQTEGTRTSCSLCIDNSDSGPGSTSIVDCTCNTGFMPMGYAQGTPSCEGCAMGMYESQGTCRVCAAGKFTSMGAQTSCQQCPARSTHNTDFTGSMNHTHCVCEKGFKCRLGSLCTSGDCDECPAGTYQPELVDDPTCRPCPANSQSLVASRAETDCLCNVGYFATDYTCTACAAGTYSDELDAAACTVCGAGFVSAPAQAVCTPCPVHSSTYNEQRLLCTCDVGYFREGPDCVPCREGTFKEDTGDQQCTSCPDNTESLPASTRLQQCRCQPGYSEDSPAVCVKCETDFYKETAANEPCTRCGVGLFTTAEGSRNMSDCVCAPGTFLGSGCEACAANSYKPAYGNGSCTACTGNSLSPPGSVRASDCTCTPGYSSGGDACVMCAPGKHKADANNSACVDCIENYFAYNEGQAQCDPCPGNSMTHGQQGRALCDCVLGYERGEDSAPCQLCREGTFKTDVLIRNCSRCASCGSDEYVQASSDVCSPFQDVACTPCAANSWIEAGQQNPSPCFCLAGWESSSLSTPTRTECQACQPGTFRAEYRDNSVPCAPCPYGSWSATLHSALCQPWSQHCPEPDVSFVTREGNTTHDITCKACTECAPGSYTSRTCGLALGDNRADTECVACEAGFICAGGINREKCRDNSISRPGSSDAAACGCLPGFYDYDGLCQMCEVDTFCTDGVRSSCPAHSITLRRGAENVLDCNCRLGYYRLGVTASSFQCAECSADDWCFNNSAYNCSDDRMETDDMAWHPGNCTCVSGWYNTNFSTAEVAGRCGLCPANTYCERGLMYSCPANTWTQGLTGMMEASACTCVPGMYLVAGVCLACPWHHYCPGDGLAVACHDNSQTENVGMHSVEQCLCVLGYEPGGFGSYSSTNASCSACAPEEGHQQNGFFKDWMGNTQCRPCTRCVVADDRVFLYEACSARQDARCQACNDCLNQSVFVGLTTQDVCQDRTDAVCKPCSLCTPDVQFQLQACTESVDTVCRQVNRELDCDAGWYRGGHTATMQSRCLPCSLRTASAPSRFKTSGLRYDDAFSCQVECLGYATIRNTSEHSWGCETCETGNVLLKMLSVAVDSEHNQVNCSFECRPGYVRAGNDCVMASVMGGHNLALEVVSFEKTVTGFTFDVHHSNHSRFVLLVGPAAPVHCVAEACCWRGLWRVSTLHQMGLLRDENCSASPALLSAQLTPSTLRFELPETRLESVARCASVVGEVAGRVCVLTLSLLDVMHRRLHTQAVRLYVHRADSHVVHLRGHHTYVPLSKFAVDVQPLVLRNGSTVYSVITRVQASEWPVRISMRVRDMRATVLTDDETQLCSRFKSAGVGLNDSQVDAELAAHEVGQLQSYWMGSPGVLHAFYTLTLQDAGNGSEHTPGSVMDVAAVRNTKGQHPACEPAAVDRFVSMGTVSAAVGLGSHVVADMVPVSYNSTINSIISSPGELGHMLTLFATADDTAVRTVSLQGLLAVYVRGQAVLELEVQAATSMTRGRLDFTRDFRRWCNARPNECVYEYLMPWHLYDNVHELVCPAGSPSVDSAAQAWIRQSFGAVHDGGHVAALCQKQQRLADTSHRSLVLLVHGMRFLSRATGGWGREVVFGKPPDRPSHSVFWPLLIFET